jgi:paraquat-inducible protein B
VVVFKQTLRGLTPGAPVEFQGIPIGEVKEIRAQVDANTFEFSAPVTISLDPTRLGVKIPGWWTSRPAPRADRFT